MAAASRESDGNFVVRLLTSWNEKDHGGGRHKTVPEWGVMYGTGRTGENPADMHSLYHLPLPVSRFGIELFAMHAFLQWAGNPMTAENRREHVRDTAEGYDPKTLCLPADVNSIMITCQSPLLAKYLGETPPPVKAGRLAHRIKSAVDQMVVLRQHFDVIISLDEPRKDEDEDE